MILKHATSSIPYKRKALFVSNKIDNLYVQVHGKYNLQIESSWIQVLYLSNQAERKVRVLIEI